MDNLDILLNKCRDGNCFEVKSILLEGVSPNIQNSEGTSPLQIASAYGFSDIVELLLSKGASVDLPNNYGWTPLMHAVRHGHSEVVYLLIQMKAKVNISNRLGLRPIDLAAWNGNVSCVNLLIEAGAIIDNLPSSSNQCDLCDLSSLMAASLQGHGMVLRTLLEKGSSVDQSSPITGLTPLMLAACCGYMHIVEILIEWGVDVNKADKCGRTALDLAIVCRKKSIITYLENITHPTFAKVSGIISHDTNIVHAVKSGDITKVKSLLQHNPNSSNYLDPTDGITPLMVASMLGHENIVEVLISNGADLNAQDMSDGWTSLMYAVFHRQAKTVHLLLDKGAKVDICTSNGYTALDLAIHIDSSETDIVETLTSHSASEELLDNQEYLTASPGSTLKKSHFTSEKTPARSDTQAFLKDWIGGLSSHLSRRLSKSSALSSTADSQVFDETFTDVFVEDNGTGKTLEGKYLSISKFYAPNQRFAHILKDQEVEAINLPPLPCEPSYIDSVKMFSSRKSRHYRSKQSKQRCFNSLRTPNLLKKNPSEYPTEVPKTCILSESLDSQDTHELTIKTALDLKPKLFLKSKNSKCKQDCFDISEEAVKDVTVLEKKELLKKFSAAKMEKDLDSKSRKNRAGDTSITGLTTLLKEGSLLKYAEKLRDQEIDLDTFQHLTEDDLDEIGIKSLESRHRFMEIIEKSKNS